MILLLTTTSLLTRPSLAALATGNRDPGGKTRRLGRLQIGPLKARDAEAGARPKAAPRRRFFFMVRAANLDAIEIGPPVRTFAALVTIFDDASA
jgi:hypothetical protein